MARCAACAKDLEPTTYGRCPICGAVLAADAALARDAARGRSRVSGDEEPEPSGGGSCCALAVGIPSLMACIGLISVGQRAHWTSDGPAMLYIMLAIVFTALLAASCLAGAVLPMIPGGRKLIDLFDFD